MIDWMEDAFEKYAMGDYEFTKFERIENPPSKRRDLCGFLYLDKMFPGSGDIVSAAEHDQIWLDVDMETFSRVATEEDILYLVRCGVFYSHEVNSLSMFE